MQTLKFKKLDKGVKNPFKKHNNDSGFDLYTNEDSFVEEGKSVVIKTGLSFDIPYGFEIQVRPRSGVSSNTNLLVVVGTVDQTYKGEVSIIVRNLGQARFIPKYYKIAQIVLCPVEYPELVEVEDIGTSDRGSNGFGSTGV